MSLVAATGMALQAFQRFSTFHNETFDLAFYARMAWGLVRFDLWEPILDASVLGLHISPVVIPLGLLGTLFGTVPVLLVAQSLAIGLAAVPLASMGARHFGRVGGSAAFATVGAFVGAAVWLAYPNLVHVATYEFHPGTMAVLPMVLLADALDRQDAKHVKWSCVAILLCREDFALMTAMAGLVFAWQQNEAQPWRTRVQFIWRHRKTDTGARVFIGSLLYLLLFVAVLHPLFKPAEGSMELHFGKWGRSIPEAFLNVLLHPGLLLQHLSDEARVAYVLRLFGVLLFLPLLRPSLLLVASPVLAINLLSEWPTTVALDSHYQTAALPFLVAGAIGGASRLAGLGKRAKNDISVNESKTLIKLRIATVSIALVGTTVTGFLAWGGSPVSADYDASKFREDADSTHAAAVLAPIDDEARVQAPYALMPHIAERKLFGPQPPPDRNAEFVILDGWHRETYRHREDLIRTTEEPVLRNWLAKKNYGLRIVSGRYFLFERGLKNRETFGGRYLQQRRATEDGLRLTACLRVVDYELDSHDLRLLFAADGACAADLGMRLGTGDRPTRMDLLFDGYFSPAHLVAGDVAASTHALSGGEIEALEACELRIGLIRQSGARPEFHDPNSVNLCDLRRGAHRVPSGL